MPSLRACIALAILAVSTAAQLGVPVGPFVTIDAVGSSPHLAADRGGVVVAAFRSGASLEMAVSRSTDLGESWSAPVVLDPGSTAEDQAVATDHAGKWVGVWETAGGPVKVSASTDGGITWSTPVSLFTVGVLGDMSLVHDGAGTWMLVYRVGLTLFLTTSSDGLTWSAPIVHPVAGPGLNLLQSPRLATDGQGRVIMGFKGTLAGGSFKARTTSTTDGGATWSVPTVVPGAAGSHLAIDCVGDSCLVVVAFDSTAYAVHSDDFGSTWGTPRCIECQGATAGEAPRVAGDGTGTWIACWSSGQIPRISRTDDDGFTWSNPEDILTVPLLDAGTPVCAGVGLFVGCVGDRADATSGSGPVASFTIDLCSLTTPAAAGTGEDFVLGTSINGLGCPLAGVKPAQPGDFVGLVFGSEAATFDGSIGALLVQATLFGTLPPSPFPGIAVNPLVSPGVAVFLDGVVVEPGGTFSGFTMPTGLGGIDLILQAFALTSSSANGIFASTPAHLIRGL